MVAYGPSSLDMLATQGIIPMDAQAFVTGTPSPYLQQCGIYTQPNPMLQDFSPTLPGQPIVDQYNQEKHLTEPTESKWQLAKTIGAAVLGTYLLGFICSKGKKNPIDGLNGIWNVGAWCTKKIGRLFKKS